MATNRPEATRTTLVDDGWVTFKEIRDAVFINLDGPQDFISEIKSRPRVWRDLSHLKSDIRGPDAEADTLTRDFSHAVELARLGWPEAVHRVRRGLDLPPAVVARLAPHLGFDVGGQYPDVPRFVAGERECMVDLRWEMSAHRRVVRIAASPSSHAGLNPKRLDNWGAALVNCIDEMETLGMRAEIHWLSVSAPRWAVRIENSGYGIGGPDFVVRMMLKEAGQPLDVERIAFWLMHPSAQRRLQFALKETHDIEPFYKDAYGLVDMTVDQHRALMKKYVEKDEILLWVGDGAASFEEGITMIKAGLALEK